jgi:hypothetical protein
MQFDGNKGTAVFVALVLIACTAGFGSGWLVGRHYPVHGFQRYGETRYLFDSVTGKLCDPLKDPNAPISFTDLYPPPDAKPEPPACGK